MGGRSRTHVGNEIPKKQPIKEFEYNSGLGPKSHTRLGPEDPWSFEVFKSSPIVLSEPHTPVILVPELETETNPSITNPVSDASGTFAMLLVAVILLPILKRFIR